jgi:hypothetical protein
MLTLIFTLRYLCIVLECDSPILEAIHLRWDRIESEFCMIIPSLHAQLTVWGYTFVQEPNLLWTRSRFGDNRTCLAVRADLIGFSVVHNLWSSPFSFQVNSSFNDDEITTYLYHNRRRKEADCFGSRDLWYNKLLVALDPTRFYEKDPIHGKTIGRRMRPWRQ